MPEFTFDDFQFDDEIETFDFTDDAPLPGLEDEFDQPNLDEADDDNRVNRTFIMFAITLIVLFVFGLGAVLLLASRNNGPTAAELTTTAIYATNSAAMVALNLTETQSSYYQSLTLTAAAVTATPSPTATSTRPPTVTPTPTLDATALAGTLAAEQMSAAATAAALGTLQALAAQQAANASLEELWSTEVAFVTQQAAVVQAQYGTQIAMVSIAADNAMLTQVAFEALSTQVAIEQQGIMATQASIAIDAYFATRLPGGGAFATLAFVATPTAQQRQNDVLSFFAQPTEPAPEGSAGDAPAVSQGNGPFESAFPPNFARPFTTVFETFLTVLGS